MANLQADGWTFEDLKYVILTEEETDIWRLNRGDILFNRTNSKELVGKCEVFDEPGEWVFASYMMRLAVDRRQVLPAFVSTFLNGSCGRAQIERESRQIIGMTNINAEEIRSLQIPLPDLGTQRALLTELDAARAGRDQGLLEADTLLSGLDGFLLSALGLSLPPPHDPTRPFAVRLVRLTSGGKLVPAYYHPDRLHATDSIRATGSFDTIAGVATIERSQRVIEPSDFYVGLARVASNTGELTDVEEIVEGSVVTFLPGDVLFARLRPYLNKVWVADRAGVASPEFYVLRPVPHVSADYLAALLRSSLTLAQTRHLMTGNTHPRIGPEDFEAILIPLGTAETRSRIAAEANRCREEARRLRIEARAGWEAARARFEDALLGPAG